ncbi:hypothetical protein KTH_54690 [Thermosporothrix hazakensis]|jgi:hypothetical protein|nr:hypothetical protein KTC_19620 [Thermosporothrix sp. COM3]GCE50600.1 hypothetical protein KTH_54690 [Thermosporothrix hazakensis]
MKGKEQKRLPPFSIEFEVQRPGGVGLLKYGFIRSSDPTVREEYKSPIYRSLDPFYPALEMLKKLSSLVGSSCGTHIHVECCVKEKVSVYYHAIFGRLLEYMVQHRQETSDFWGRNFCRYACSRWDGRYSAFNPLSDYPTLEYRLPRFRSKEQFLAVLWFVRRCTSILNRKLSTENVSPAELGEEILHLYIRALSREHSPAPELELVERHAG